MLELNPALLNEQDLFVQFFDVIYNLQNHDMAVGEQSAISIFDSKYMTSENGPHKNHVELCFENSIANKVLDLLKGGLSNFDTSGVGKTSSSSFSMSATPANPPVAMNTESHREVFLPADTGEVNDYFLTKYTISIIDPDGLEYTSFADSTIAELTEYGKIRGLKSGRKTFRAIYGRIEASINIDVDVISETPSRSGTFKLTFTVSNIAGSVSRTFILTINQAPEDVKSDDSKPKDNNIVIGPARGVASLSAVELAMVSNDRSMIAAILPEITVNVSALYSFEGIEIDAKVPAGYVLVWNAFARVSGSEIKASDEREAMFTDESGQEITTVPNSHIINVSAYLEAGNTYAPVVSALIPDDRKVGVENSSGGCSVVPSILILAAFGIFVGRKK